MEDKSKGKKGMDGKDMGKNDADGLTEQALAEVVTGEPRGTFDVGERHFELWPVTLAKMMKLKRYVGELGLDEDVVKANPFLEALRVCKDKRETCCFILAIHATPNSKAAFFDFSAIKDSKDYLAAHIAGEDLATLLLFVLGDDTDKLIEGLGLSKERERMGRVLEVKKKHDTSSMAFGGLTLFGTFIGQLKEMGYNDDEILYEKGYTYLRLMLADKVQQVILTEDEKNDLPDKFGGNKVDANDPENAKKLQALLQSRGVGVGQTKHTKAQKC